MTLLEITAIVSAWEWDVPGYHAISGHAERDASYLTNFFYFQPALNFGFANPSPSKPWQQLVDAPGPRRVRAVRLEQRQQ